MAQVERGENTGEFSEEERVALESTTGHERHCYLGAHGKMEDAASLDLTKKKIEGEKCIVASKARIPKLLFTCYIPVILGIVALGNIHICIFYTYHLNFYSNKELLHSLGQILCLLVLYVLFKNTTLVRSFIFLNEIITFENLSGHGHPINLSDIKMLRVKEDMLTNTVEVLLERNDNTKLIIPSSIIGPEIDKLRKICESNGIALSFRKYRVRPAWTIAPFILLGYSILAMILKG